MVRALVDLYACALDNGDRDGFEDLWTPNGVLEVFENGPTRPRTGFLRARRDFHLAFNRLAVYARTMHHTTTHVVDFDWNGATGTTYCEAHHLSTSTSPASSAAVDLVMQIRYVDQFAETHDGCRFQHRRVEVLFTEERPVQLHV